MATDTPTLTFPLTLTLYDTSEPTQRAVSHIEQICAKQGLKATTPKISKTVVQHSTRYTYRFSVATATLAGKGYVIKHVENEEIESLKVPAGTSGIEQVGSATRTRISIVNKAHPPGLGTGDSVVVITGTGVREAAQRCLVSVDEMVNLK